MISRTFGKLHRSGYFAMLHLDVRKIIGGGFTKFSSCEKNDPIYFTLYRFINNSSTSLLSDFL